LRNRLLFTIAFFTSIIWLFQATKTASVTPSTSTTPGAALVKKVDFNRDIRPILADTCFKCHGPDEQSRMANLRLDETEGLFTDRGGYKIIVPGHPEESRLYEKISATDEAMKMPPTYSGRTLTPKQIETFKEWIEQGAKWDTLWSLVPPKRPELPEVKEKGWVRNPIDNFVLAHLEQQGVNHSPEADKATLLRRVYFDLTGLPPTPAQIDAFIADKSSDAYEKRVDQLLASPHYGERMTMPWLDLARYADTHGYHIDSMREMWPWRDWVIRSFNQNLPYDQFIVDQIAGDMLPHATLDQKVASGFNRNHMITLEGGAIPEEYHVEYLVDRVSTTSTAFLGLTMGCARCHDHKYDPITQKDFYRFVAFFNTVPEKGLDGFTGNAVPILPLPSHEQQVKSDELDSEIEATMAALPEKEMRAKRNEWQKTALASLPEATHDGLAAYYPMDSDLNDASGHHHDAKAVRGQVVFDEGVLGNGGYFSPETTMSMGDAGQFERNKPFSIHLWVMPPNVSAVKVLTKHAAGSNWQGWELADDKPIFDGPTRREAHYILRLAKQWPDDAIEVQTKELVQINKGTYANGLRQIAVTYDGSGKASGVKFYEGGKQVETVTLKDHLTGSIASSAALEVGDKELGTPFDGSMDDIRLYDRVLSDVEIQDLTIRQPARALLTELDGRPTAQIDSLMPEDESDVQIGSEDKAPTKEEQAAALEKQRQGRLNIYFLKYGANQKDRQLYAKLETLRDEKAKLDDEIPTVMVMGEMKKPRKTYILGRGQYDNPKDEVTANTPAVLPPMAPGLPMNRLGLAKWLVDPKNPLTARVAVNHFWQEYFGIGIVKTSEDFGSQGEPPSNQALLDWLATEFVRTGWNVKAMQRLIVTSATYRQSSLATPEVVERDPDNRLLGRGPRFRLPAELIRDNALSVSGLLDKRIGGESVSPYQPKGLWEEMAFGEGYTGQIYVQSKGEDLYRRSMYTVWKRTVPPPSLVTFDAPDREKCTARRSLTNTPLQALVLLNDPTYVEASRFLAARMMTEGGKTAATRVDFAFRLATGRLPDAQERAILLDQVKDALANYRAHPDEANELLGVGEAKSSARLNVEDLAAYTTVAGVILNLDETITKE
jgi:hypothetical protein